MGFWNVVKMKADEYSRTAAQKTNKFMEKTKRSITLTEYEDKVKNLYALIGERVYEANSTGIEAPDFEGIFAQISEYEENIDRLNAEIDDLKR